MVTNAADYQWVQGITNGEVVIDGGIMPARDTAYDPVGIMQPRCLRGEDVCFCAEAVHERNFVAEAGTAQQPMQYDHTVNGGAWQEIIGGLWRHISSYDAQSGCYVQPSAELSSKHSTTLADITHDNLIAYFYPEVIITSAMCDASDFDPGRALSGDSVRKVYHDLSQTRRMNFGNFPVTDTADHTPNANAEVQSSRELHLAGSDFSTVQYPPAQNFDNRTSIRMGYGGARYGSGSFSSYCQKFVTPATWQMKLKLPPAIVPYIDRSDITVVFCMTLYSYVVSNSFSDEYKSIFDFFPVSGLSANSQGEITLNKSIVDQLLDHADQTRTDTGYTYPGLMNGGNRVIVQIDDYIWACPVIVRLGERTDFSALGWTWTP